jgi:hypothetical protein
LTQHFIVPLCPTADGCPPPRTQRRTCYCC